MFLRGLVTKEKRTLCMEVVLQPVPYQDAAVRESELTSFKGVQLLDLVTLDSKYVGIYFLVLVKTDLNCFPNIILKLPFGAWEMAQWMKCQVRTRYGGARPNPRTWEAEPSGCWGLTSQSS